VKDVKDEQSKMIHPDEGHTSMRRMYNGKNLSVTLSEV
jgi:hypothetical protein